MGRSAKFVCCLPAWCSCEQDGTPGKSELNPAVKSIHALVGASEGNVWRMENVPEHAGSIPRGGPPQWKP